MDVHAVIPLKDPALGKSRLARALTLPERIELIRAMLEHVVGVLTVTGDVRTVDILTSAPHLVPRGAAYLCDQGLDLNSAVAHAARELRARGAAGTLLVVHADLPLLAPGELEELLAASGEHVLAVAPDWTDAGTNALAFALTRAVATRFGAGSLAAHAEVARASGLDLLLVRRRGLAYDIDEPAQLRELADRAGPRYGFLKEALGRMRQDGVRAASAAGPGLNRR